MLGGIRDENIVNGERVGNENNTSSISLCRVISRNVHCPSVKRYGLKEKKKKTLIKLFLYYYLAI